MARRNPLLDDPEGSFKRLRSQVESTKTVMSQLNEVARFLAGHGYARAHDPEGHETWAAASPGERPAKLQFFVWMNTSGDPTPFGDDIILQTGPSFKPALLLGAMVPKDPGIGVYIQSLVTKLRGDTRAAMARAESKGPRRQETFAEAKARKSEERREERPPTRSVPLRPGPKIASPTPRPATAAEKARSKAAGDAQGAASAARLEKLQRDTAAASAKARADADRAAERGRNDARVAEANRQAERDAARAQAEADRKLKDAEAAAAKLAEQEDDAGANKELGDLADILAKRFGL